MNDRPIAAGTGNAEAVRELAARAGLMAFDAHRPAETLAAIGRALRRLSNPQVELRDAAAIAEVRIWLAFGRGERALPPPVHLNGPPAGFAPQAAWPEFRMAELPDAWLCHYAGAPLIVSAQGDAVARDLGSRYAALVHFRETPLRAVLADAPHVPGTLVAIADDAHPPGFDRWLLDWLPRLACLGEQVRRPDMFVAVPTLTEAWQWETLRLCGVAPARVVQLGPMQAVRARRLLVPAAPHAGHVAAPWVADFLRGTLGHAAFLAGLDGPPRRRKVCILPDDAALAAALAPFGYEPASLAGLPAARRFALFAGASHVVAGHGPELAAIAFAQPPTTLLEIFPSGGGSATAYTVAASLGLTYASCVAGAQPIDIPDFLTRAGPWL